jgi:hypothetical protein
MYTYTSSFRMTDTMTSQNTEHFLLGHPVSSQIIGGSTRHMYKYSCYKHAGTENKTSVHAGSSVSCRKPLLHFVAFNNSCRPVENHIHSEYKILICGP